MNGKIVIPVSIIITIVVVVFSLTQNEIFEEQVSEFKNPSEIEDMLDIIKNEKSENEKSENPFIPKEREWIQSGPFKIDRSEYALGEKIFININYLPKNVKGEMIFTKIINSTYSYEYGKIKFDGSKPQQNFYLGLNLNKFMGICAADMLIGDWKVIFQGTEYSDLKFKVTKEIIPGYEERYEPIC